jgi:hypothetical protein
MYIEDTTGAVGPRGDDPLGRDTIGISLRKLAYEFVPIADSVKY